MRWRWIGIWTAAALLPMLGVWVLVVVVPKLWMALYWGGFPERWMQSHESLRWDVVLWVAYALVLSGAVKVVLEGVWFSRWRSWVRGWAAAVGGCCEGLVWWFAAGGLLGLPLARAPHEVMRWGPLQTIYAAEDPPSLWEEPRVWLRAALHALLVRDSVFTSIGRVGFTGDGQRLWTLHEGVITVVRGLEGGAAKEASRRGDLREALLLGVDPEGVQFFASVTPEGRVEITREGQLFWASPVFSVVPVVGAEVALQFTAQGAWTVAWLEGERLSVQAGERITHVSLPALGKPLVDEEDQGDASEDAELIEIDPEDFTTPTRAPVAYIVISEDGRWVGLETAAGWDLVEVNTARVLRVEAQARSCPSQEKRLRKFLVASDYRWNNTWDIQGGVLVFPDENRVRVVDFSATWAARCALDGVYCRLGAEDIVGAHIVQPQGVCVWGLKLTRSAEKLALLERVFSGSTDKNGIPSNIQDTVTLWALPEGAEEVSLPHANVVSALAFSPDGGKLATSETDGMLHLWELP